ncbi:hypothetical protein V6N13_083347 [Hibiscus sabdariffa]|uniref:Uncharacterized protein n=1 Tax=Hibiscus sabdariffa TaxID=183260 RepID=A0ABR2SYK5_9ROSI
MDSDLNHNRTPKIVNGPSEILRDEKEIAERNMGENKHPRSPIWKSVDEEHRVEQGEDEFYSSSDREENCNKAERVFFPELVLKKTIQKRYGSLKQIQDKSISEKERKRRDRAARKEKQLSSGGEASKLSGRSLSESNLVHHKEIFTKRAKKALALGKRLGVEIEGNEEGVLNELVRLESLN